MSEAPTGQAAPEKPSPESDRARKAPTDPPSQGDIAARLSPHFRMVFVSILAFSMALFVTRIVLVIAFPTPNDAMKDIIASCAYISTAGFGAILGLMGGKLS